MRLSYTEFYFFREKKNWRKQCKMLAISPTKHDISANNAPIHPKLAETARNVGETANISMVLRQQLKYRR